MPQKTIDIRERSIKEQIIYLIEHPEPEYTELLSTALLNRITDHLLGLPEMRVSGEHNERFRVRAIRGAIAEALGVKE